MVTLGFFTVGGSRWAPHTEMPQIAPDANYFQVSNSTQEACRACVQTQMRCAALRDPWQSECNRFAASVVVAQTSSCEVSSYVTAGGAPSGDPVVPALAACSSVCVSPMENAVHLYESGYMRPYLAFT